MELIADMALDAFVLPKNPIGACILRRFRGLRWNTACSKPVARARRAGAPGGGPVAGIVEQTAAFIACPARALS